jgi:hypothetical protein
MASLVTLLSLRTQALQRADAVNDPFFTTAEVNQYLNNSYAELYDLLTARVEGEYNLQQYFFRSGSQNQSIGVGAPGVTAFSATLLATPIVPGSVQIYNNAFLASDNGSGAITATGLTGTVNYSTGALTLTFATPPATMSLVSTIYTGSVMTTDTYPLPINHYKPRGIDILTSGILGGGYPPARYANVGTWMFQERNQYNFMSNPVAVSQVGGVPILYRLLGQTIKLIPAPTVAQQSYQFWYIPAYSPMVNDSDTVDGVNGWEEYIVLDTVIKMQAKQETDTAPWDMGKAAMLARIEAMSASRDAGLPQRISDTVVGQTSGPYAAGGLPF